MTDLVQCKITSWGDARFSFCGKGQSLMECVKVRSLAR